MVKVDLDFQRYVERRRGAREAQAREGAAYAYAGDRKLRGTLDRLRPVRVALEGAVRLWNSAARKELLGEAPKVTANNNARVHALIAKCAQLLHVSAPATYVTDGAAPRTFGTNEDPTLVLPAALLSSLTDPELLALVGRELGRIQNGHVGFATALYYLQHHANRFVRWTVAPAILALKSWASRAEVTADRAGLLTVRDLGVAEAVVRKVAAEDPRLEGRVGALRLFADTAYYKSVLGEQGGIGSAECDAKIAELL